MKHHYLSQVCRSRVPVNTRENVLRDGRPYPVNGDRLHLRHQGRSSRAAKMQRGTYA